FDSSPVVPLLPRQTKGAASVAVAPELDEQIEDTLPLRLPKSTHVSSPRPGPTTTLTPPDARTPLPASSPAVTAPAVVPPPSASLPAPAVSVPESRSWVWTALVLILLSIGFGIIYSVFLAGNVP